MEFCSESSLDVVLASKRELPWELRVKIAYDMAMGLHVLHSSTPPVTHRDLRSPNIFVRLTSFPPPNPPLPAVRRLARAWSHCSQAKST